jgi:hypothetical protein
MRQTPITTYSDSRFNTDDRGVYRIYSLPAGRYIMNAYSYTRGQTGWVFHPGVIEGLLERKSEFIGRRREFAHAITRVPDSGGTRFG